MQSSSSAPVQLQPQSTVRSNPPQARKIHNSTSQAPESVLAMSRQFLVDIYRYREYLKQSVARDLRRRYKRSVLGYLWSMLNPLLMMTILAVVFSSVMRQNIENYAVFLFCGMLPFSYFSATAMGCLGTIRSNAKIIEQISVPTYLFPLSIGFSGLVDLVLSLFPLFLVMLVCGSSIKLTVLALPILLVPLFCVTMGVALIVAVSNVFFEDTQHLIDVVLRALYFLCPILYSKELLPQWLQPWVALNPLFGQIEYMRDIFYFGRLPAFGPWALNSLGCFFILIVGLVIFRKSEKKFVYFM